MDYDDNDFQGQNPQLAGEGSTKFSSVLRPYALPKFDFDDSLQGHLRFDNLVETEVFLGIESQEDSQWIDDFSRGSSGIEFSSSAAESCSISRRNNVWSEATSSESVEMLLKSVGQEEMIPGQTIIEESDACDELGSSTKKMEPSLKQDDKVLSKVGDIIDSGPSLPPDEIQKNFSGLNKDAGGGVLQVEDTFQGHEGEPSTYGSSSDLDPNSVGEKHGLPLTEENLLINSKCNVANQREVDMSLVGSLDNRAQEDTSGSRMQVDNLVTSLQNIGTDIGQLNNQEASHQVNDTSDEIADGLQKDNGEGKEESHVLSKEVQLDDHNMEGYAVESGTYSLEKSLSLMSKVKSKGEQNAVETSINNVEEPFSMIVRGDSHLQIVEGCSEDVCPIIPVHSSKCKGVVLSNDTEIGDHFKDKMLERSPVSLGDDKSFEGHAVDFSNSTSGICSRVELKKDSLSQMTYGPGSFVDKKEELLESGNQMDSVISASNSEASLLSVEGNKDGSSNSHKGDLSGLKVVLSSAELIREPPTTETTKSLEGVTNAFGVCREESNGDDRVSSSILTETTICEENVVSKQGDVSNCDRDVSVVEKESAKLPIDSSDKDCENVGSLITDKKVGSSPLGEGSTKNEVIVRKSQSDTSAGNEPASDVALEDANLVSNDTSDRVLLPSGNVVTNVEVVNRKDEKRLPALVVDFTHLDNKEEAATGISTKASLSTLNECSQVASELGPVSEFEKGVSSDTTGQLIYEMAERPAMVEICNTANQSDPQEAVADKINQEYSKEVSVLGDSKVKEDRGAELVAFGNREEETMKENHEEASSKVAGDASNSPEGSFSPVCMSECDPKSRMLEGGSSCLDSDKPSCGSPTVISCTELSKSDKEKHKGFKGPLDQSVPLSEVNDGAANKVCSISQDLKENDASKDERSFSFEVSPLADLSERDTGKGWQPFTSIQASKVSPIVEGSPSVSGLGQMDSKVAQQIGRGSPRVSDGQAVIGGSRGTPERKTRRASGKATGRESAKKGNMKEATPARQSERVDKSCIVSPSPPSSCQLVQSEEMQHSGHVERNNRKPSNVFTTPSSSLPDLNTSASLPAVFQQPFTDLQQVQLRAQIFVYGSLIQGTAPDEACMISAFGGSDGGRGIWENAWRVSVERLHGQKTLPSNPETPLQPRSELRFTGARGPDQANKQGALQSKVISSPIGRGGSKSTPSPVVNPMIPLSSPLWSITNPSCDGLQTSGMPRGTVMDHNQAHSPLHPYQTPPVRNFVGHNTSWLSQSPFTGPWVASPQTSAFDASARFSALPITETVKLTPVREHVSGIKHVSPSPIVHSGGPTSVFPGSSPLLDVKKTTASASQHSADPKPRKRKKVPVAEDISQIPLLPQTQAEPVSASGVSSHLSTSVAVTAPACFVSKSTAGKKFTAASPTSSTDHPKIGDRDVEQRVILSQDTLNKVKEAKLQAEDAAALAAAAVNHSQGIWSQLDKQNNSESIADVEAKLASAAVAIAAAASVAKAAAAAAKLASEAALQAKLMAEEALISSGNGNLGQINVIPLSDGVHIMGKATPASILKGENGANSSSSIIVAAREAARRRVEAASAASKRAENLDAIVKAAELAAEAVTQAGKIVAMGDPLPLSELIAAGPEGYWKLPQVSSEPVVKSNMNREQSNIDPVEDGPDGSAKHSKGGTSDEKETQNTNHGKQPTLRELSREFTEDHMRLDAISGPVTNEERDSRGQKGRKGSDLAKTIGVVPESEIGSRSTSMAPQNEYEKVVGTSTENSIKEGSLVEVFKDGDGFRAAWFSASVLSFKNGEAYVCYTEILSEEGSGKLKEWVALEGEGDKAPRVRIAHPMTTVQYEGTRKRRREAMGNYAWSVGDRVDAWIRDCWWEGVITDKNKKDETTLTVHFPAQGETSVIKAWHLRPSLIWKDGQWIEWSSLRENDRSSHEGDTPREKRLKLGSPAVVTKGKDKMSKATDVVESGMPEESRLMALSANEKVFNVGRNSRDENKPDALRTMRTGLQKEGSRVVFGVPKPGKKRKFMEVSKHYVADRSSKVNEANDSVKVTKYLMPQGSGSRGWKNNSKIDSREKRVAESKPRVLKSGKPQGVSSRGIPQKDNFLTSAASAPHDSIVTDHRANIKDSVSHDENASGKQSLTEFGSFSTAEGAAQGPILFSSLALPSDDHSSKKIPTSNSKSERANKGKLAPSGGKLAKIEEDKVYNGNSGKAIPEVVEPRRSVRRIQPTSRLLEGLQSSLIVSKIPAVSHDKGHKSQNRSASSSRGGNNHG
ncbi:hypothetical protein L1049_021907 [Liquidambar formosana]|uniref:Agenet domain-containing protein n=1 Tax=Liquidambar formosana TaxID=63359 RepID=A0AAP0RBK5_LIQFO